MFYWQMVSQHSRHLRFPGYRFHLNSDISHIYMGDYIYEGLPRKALCLVHTGIRDAGFFPLNKMGTKRHNGCVHTRIWDSDAAFEWIPQIGFPPIFCGMRATSFRLDTIVVNDAVYTGMRDSGFLLLCT